MAEILYLTAEEMSQEQAEEFTVEVATADKYRENDAVALVATVIKDYIKIMK
jgi:hypothetical protein